MFKLCLPNFELNLSLIDVKPINVLNDMASMDFPETPSDFRDAEFEVTKDFYYNGKLRLRTTHYSASYSSLLGDVRSGQASGRLNARHESPGTYKVTAVQTRAGSVDF